MKVKSLIKEVYVSPIGDIEITAGDTGVLRIHYKQSENSAHSVNATHNANENAKQVITQLSEYFSGNRKSFSLPLDLQGTKFQQDVWREISQIPYGQTRSYGEIAKRIGRPKAARAVGMACNKNQLILLIPCHRVIGSNHSLTGYEGGLQRKHWLLEHEKSNKGV